LGGGAKKDFSPSSLEKQARTENEKGGRKKGEPQTLIKITSRTADLPSRKGPSWLIPSEGSVQPKAEKGEKGREEISKN